MILDLNMWRGFIREGVVCIVGFVMMGHGS